MSAILDRSSLQDALDLFTAQTGLCFPASRFNDFEPGVRRAMVKLKIRDLDQLQARMRSDGKVLDALISELAVHETYFFREPGQYDAIRRTVVPDLVRQRDPHSAINVWSAGCATGEEAYSLAILFEQEGLAHRSRILATDLSRSALAKAVKGSYSSWSFRGGQEARAKGYFQHRGMQFVLDDRIRSRVAFEPLNLVSPPSPTSPFGSPRFDLILCRNVLIYFDAATVARVAIRLYDSLNDGGWLITSSADPPLWDHAPFERRVTSDVILYRRSSADGAGRVRGTTGLRASPAPRQMTPVEQSPSAQARSTPDDLATARRALAEGDTTRVIELTRSLNSDPEACTLHIKGLVNSGELVRAEQIAESAASRHPMCTELHYLRAVLLMDLGRGDEAVATARRVLYLDRSLIAGHLLLGSILRRQGDRLGALRAYRNARRCCENHGPDDLAELTEREPVTRLAEVARVEIAALEAPELRP